MTRLLRILSLSALAACAAGPSATPPRAPGPAPGAETPAKTARPPAAVDSVPAPNLLESPPSLTGFTVDGEPTAYDASTLFDYIDGAADGFLKFAFQQLVAIDYARQDSGTTGSLVVDIYQHANAYNGFGIYRQEQFSGGQPLEIGAGATYKPGVLIFFKGPYYVRLTGMDLGDGDAEVLAHASRAVAASLPGEAALPVPATCFPADGLEKSSIRYINEAYLGHGFLHTAFVADYEIDGAPSQMFLIEESDEASARALMDRYTALAREKGEAVEEAAGRARFQDPYLRSSAPVTLQVRGRYVVGMFAPDAAAAVRHLDALANELRERSLAD